MKRVLLVAVVGLLAGCSNAPIAGFLDTCFPSRAGNNPRPPAGARDPLPPPGRLPPPELGPPTGPRPGF
jgi:hypothetical protein